MRKINKIVIHCSDSPHVLSGKQVGSTLIKEWHLKRGFSDIGYHAVIIKDGTIQQGRDESETGAHAKGHNKDSVAVCLVGTDSFTASQFVSLKALLKLWMTRHHLGIGDVYCHYQLNPQKTCPNILIEEIKELYFRG